MMQKPLRYTLHSIGYDLVESLFPQKRSCKFCGRFWLGSKLRADLCGLCLEQWRQMRQAARICTICGSFNSGDPCQGPCAEIRGTKTRHSGSVSSIIAAAPYLGIYRQRMIAFKYNGQQKLAASMAHLMAEAWRENQERLGNEQLYEPAVTTKRIKPRLVPVPMHRDKEATRGYNQSRLLARAISRETGYPVEELLSRRIQGSVQAELNRDQRMRALDHVYEWAAYGEAKPGPAIIVDDVVTTGATMEACGRILKERGYGPIWGLSFAGGSSQNVKNTGEKDHA